MGILSVKVNTNFERFEELTNELTHNDYAGATCWRGAGAQPHLITYTNVVQYSLRFVCFGGGDVVTLSIACTVETLKGHVLSPHGLVLFGEDVSDSELGVHGGGPM